jgi:aminocarboxymuconate-semialdehyde decarboxylase
VLSGIMERHPKLKIFMSHTGGVLPYQSGRMDKNTKTAKLPLPASAYIKRMYTDTVSPQAAGIRFAVEYFGTDHVLFGSDYPCWNSEESLKFFAEAGLSAGAKEKVFSTNARRLFGLLDSAFTKADEAPHTRAPV